MGETGKQVNIELHERLGLCKLSPREVLPGYPEETGSTMPHRHQHLQVLEPSMSGGSTAGLWTLRFLSCLNL